MFSDDVREIMESKCLGTWYRAQRFCEAMEADDKNSYHHVKNILPLIQELRSHGYDRQFMASYTHRGISLRRLNFSLGRDPYIEIEAHVRGGMTVRLRNPRIYVAHECEDCTLTREVEEIILVLLAYPIVLNEETLSRDTWWK